MEKAAGNMACRSRRASRQRSGAAGLFSSGRLIPLYARQPVKPAARWDRAYSYGGSTKAAVEISPIYAVNA